MFKLLPKYSFTLETRPFLCKMGPKKERNVMTSFFYLSEEQKGLVMCRVEKYGEGCMEMGKDWFR